MLLLELFGAFLVGSIVGRSMGAQAQPVTITFASAESDAAAQEREFAEIHRAAKARGLLH